MGKLRGIRFFYIRHSTHIQTPDRLGKSRCALAVARLKFKLVIIITFIYFVHYTAHEFQFYIAFLAPVIKSPITSSVLAFFGSEAVSNPSSSITTSTLVGSSVLTVAISVEVSALPLGVNNVISRLGVGTAKISVNGF